MLGGRPRIRRGDCTAFDETGNKAQFELAVRGDDFAPLHLLDHIADRFDRVRDFLFFGGNVLFAPIQIDIARPRLVSGLELFPMERRALDRQPRLAVAQRGRLFGLRHCRPLLLLIPGVAGLLALGQPR